MSYIHNTYHYQVAVVSAIIIGGVQLLAGIVYAIYVVVLKDTRADNKQWLDSARNSTQRTQAPQQFKQTEPKFKNAGTQTTNDYQNSERSIQKCAKSVEDESRQMIDLLLSIYETSYALNQQSEYLNSIFSTQKLSQTSNSSENSTFWKCNP